jgi:hypothetical protein
MTTGIQRAAVQLSTRPRASSHAATLQVKGDETVLVPHGLASPGAGMKKGGQLKTSHRLTSDRPPVQP